jgi:type IV pilus assembly protein PilX
VVHRLCETTGAPHIANCAKPPAGANTGGSFSAGGPAQIASNQVYYRITTRITGPRNTVAYLQTVVRCRSSSSSRRSLPCKPGK